MVQTPKPSKRRIATLGFTGAALAILFLASLAPLAGAQSDSPKASDQGKEDRREAAKERHEAAKERREAARDRHEDRREDGNASGSDKVVRSKFTISLNGTMVTKDNVTYTFSLDGAGKGRYVKDGDKVERLGGIAEARLVVKDANGTVVKDKVLRVMVRAHQGADGNWTWGLMTNPWHRPGGHLVLRGDATRDARGVYLLDGKGGLGFKIDPELKPLRGHVQVSGQLVRL
jgi:hypothetical protein